MDIEKILSELTIEELIGQTLCISVSQKTKPEEFVERVKKERPGGIFLTDMQPDKIKFYTDLANQYLNIPIVVTSDVEDGPHTPILGGEFLPNQMAFGACDDVELTEKAGVLTAQTCRINGVHWGFNPVVDLNINFRCPECNIRSISDKPEHVIKIAGAYLKGFRKDGMMACSCKHFPGQGADDRNSHLVTIENGLSKEDWMNSVGKVYRELFKQGVDSVMIGHCSLPAFETEKDQFGYIPATISKTVITDLLKGELGFEGVVISDAMSMIGVTSRISLDELPVQFIKAGGDMVLFPKPRDFDNIMKAIESGEISKERIIDAARRVLQIKQRLHLFEKDYFKDLKVEGNLKEVSLQIAQKGVKILRDFGKTIPVKLKKGSKVLLLNIIEPFFNKPPKGDELNGLKKEFERNGMIVTSMDNADYREVNKIKDDYDLIMMNSILSSRNYHGGSMRAGWNSILVMWDGYVLDHPNVIFTSFGDPYKIHEFPYVKTYINAFSHYEESQVAVAKVVLGQIPALGKNPVQFDGYFDREV